MNEEFFQTKFIKPLAECYGITKFPAIRVRMIWDKVKHFPEHLFAQCAEKVILTHDNFPGVSAILQTCAEFSSQYMREQHDEIKSKHNCFRCKSQGVIVVNNYAYKCTCKLGELCYPAYPLYQGQAQFTATRKELEDGTLIFETGSYIYTRPARAESVKDFAFVIKSNSNTKPRNNNPDFKKLGFENIGA